MLPLIGPDCNTSSSWLCIEPANAGTAASTFGFSEYLAALALLLVVFAISDFKYRYRFELTRLDWRKIAFYVSITIGALILVVDLYFYKKWPVISILNDPNVLKLGLGAIFLILVFFLYRIAFLRPPIFNARNSQAYFLAMRHHVARGNPDHLVVVADELEFSIKSVLSLAAYANPRGSTCRGGAEDAHELMLLLADRKLCRVMVDRSPVVVAKLFRYASELGTPPRSFGLFARNAGAELVTNEKSSLHTEDSGYDSGYFGYTKPVTRSVFGQFDLVERLAREHCSPLNPWRQSGSEFNPKQLEAYARASMIFMESYLNSSQKQQHSTAFLQILDLFSHATHGLYKLNGSTVEYSSIEARKLRITVRFLNDLVSLVDRSGIDHEGALKPRNHLNLGIHDRIAKVIMNILRDVSGVREPVWTCWSIQYNSAWVDLFGGYNMNPTWKVVNFKVRRLLYEEIKAIPYETFFQGASYLGLCLNVFGLNKGPIGGFSRGFNPLKEAVLRWTKKNYLSLMEEYPDVATHCILGSISFDAAGKRLVKTYEKGIRREIPREHLILDGPEQ